MATKTETVSTPDQLPNFQAIFAGLCPKPLFDGDRFVFPTESKEGLAARMFTYFKLKQAIENDPENSDLQAIASRVVEFEVAYAVKSYCPLNDDLTWGDKGRLGVITDEMFPQTTAVYRESLAKLSNEKKEKGWINFDFAKYPVNAAEVAAAQVLGMSKDEVNTLILCAIANSPMFTYGISTLPTSDNSNQIYIHEMKSLLAKRNLRDFNISDPAFINVDKYRYSMFYKNSTVGVTEIALFLRRAAQYSNIDTLSFHLTDDELLLATGLTFLSLNSTEKPEKKAQIVTEFVSSIDLVRNKKGKSPLDFVDLALSDPDTRSHDEKDPDKRDRLIPVFPPLEIEGLLFLAEYIESWKKPYDKSPLNQQRWFATAKQLADYVEKLAPQIINGLKSPDGKKLRKILSEWGVLGVVTDHLPGATYSGDYQTIFDPSKKVTK